MKEKFSLISELPLSRWHWMSLSTTGESPRGLLQKITCRGVCKMHSVGLCIEVNIIHACLCYAYALLRILFKQNVWIKTIVFCIFRNNILVVGWHVTRPRNDSICKSVTEHYDKSLFYDKTWLFCLYLLFQSAIPLGFVSWAYSLFSVRFPSTLQTFQVRKGHFCNQPIFQKC